MKKPVYKNQMVFGLRAAMEAIESGKEIEKLLVQNGLKGELFSDFYKLVRYHNIPFKNVPLQALNRITRKNHQGVVAYISLIEYQKTENIVPLLYEEGKDPFFTFARQAYRR
jgi:23S rRNA (guanosine2251-2'-O)-methyltransferase